MGIAADSVRTYFFRIATLITGLLMGILTARFLGPTGKGEFSLALLVGSLYTNLFGNLGGAITYQITRLKQPARTVFITASVYGWAVGLLTVAGFLAFTLLVPGFRPGIYWYVALSAPFLVALTNLSGTWLGLNRITAVNWLGLSSGIILLLAMIIGYFGFQMKLGPSLACWVGAQVLAVAGGLWGLRRIWWPPAQKEFRFQLLVDLLGFGWQLGLINLISFLNYRIDMFLVAKFLGPRNLGFYSIAVSAAEMLWFTSSAIGTSIYARVGVAEPDQAGRLTARAARHTLFINIMLGLLFWGAVELLLPIVYGEIYRPSLTPFRILLPGVLAYGLAGIFSTYFANQLGQPKFSLLVSLISMGINLGISLWLIPRMGMTGGAWATAISYLSAIAILIGFFHRKSGLGLREVLLINRGDLEDYRCLGITISHYLLRKIGWKKNG
jgi:O-antigen/teichoic acid export membrane protein